MLYTYEDFILESLINESILYFSPELRRKLRRMKTELTQDLLDNEAKDIKDDITFIDIDKDGYVSYTTMKNANKLLQDKYPHLGDTLQTKPNLELADEIYQRDKEQSERSINIYNKSRSKIKFGRLINKILPGKYTPKEIEEFSNKWKASLENTGEKFQLVEGDDIAFWYQAENYKELVGSLGSSCMRNNSDDTFKIYVMNPDICKMLILTDSDELIGRALVWKVTKKDKGSWEWFMDRQYAISDAVVEKFRNYAIEQGWAYKTKNNHSSYRSVSWPEGENVVSTTISMSIQLAPYRKTTYGNNYDYGNYPYVDTFRRYDPNTGWLYNDDDQVDGCYHLSDTGGGYEECETGVWSEWHDERIPEDEAVYSEAVESYLWRDRAVEVTRGSRRNRGWYPDGYDDIVYDEWIDEYIHIDDAVYSDAYSHYILQDDSCSAIYKLDSDGEPNRDTYYVHEDDKDYVELSDFSGEYWYEKLSAEFRTWEDGYEHKVISKDLLTRDYYDNWIPSMYSIRVYPVTEEPFTVPHLSKSDASILDININLENPKVTEKFGYNQSIEAIYPQLLSKAKEKLEKLKAENVGDDAESVAQQNKLVERIEEIENNVWIDWKPNED